MVQVHNRGELIEYIRGVVNPKTPAEWQAALSNPLSPIAQDVQALCLQQVATEELLIQLCIRQQMRQEAGKREDEARIMRDILASVMALKKMQASTIELGATPKVDAIQALEDKKMLEALISTLDSKIETTQFNMSHIKQQMKENTQAIVKSDETLQANHKTITDTFVKSLADVPIYIMVDGKPQMVTEANKSGDEATKVLTLDKIITSIKPPASFVDTLEKVPGLKDSLIKGMAEWKETEKGISPVEIVDKKQQIGCVLEAFLKLEQALAGTEDVMIKPSMIKCNRKIEQSLEEAWTPLRKNNVECVEEVVTKVQVNNTLEGQLKSLDVELRAAAALKEVAVERLNEFNNTPRPGQ